jgi:hypothetical protein
MVVFPTSPTTGQQWVAENGVTYTWTGDRWSSVIAIQAGTAVAYIDNGDAYTADAQLNITIVDGGSSSATETNTVDSGFAQG